MRLEEETTGNNYFCSYNRLRKYVILFKEIELIWTYFCTPIFLKSSLEWNQSSKFFSLKKKNTFYDKNPLYMIHHALVSLKKNSRWRNYQFSIRKTYKRRTQRLIQISFQSMNQIVPVCFEKDSEFSFFDASTRNPLVIPFHPSANCSSLPTYPTA